MVIKKFIVENKDKDYEDNVFIKYEVVPYCIDKSTIILRAKAIGKAIKKLPCENSSIICAWEHYITANKIAGVCRGLLEYGYFKYSDIATLYVEYKSSYCFISELEVLYKRNMLHKWKPASIQYIRGPMIGYYTIYNTTSWTDLYEYKEMIERSMSM